MRVKHIVIPVKALLLFFLLGACVGVKHGGGQKGGKRLFETFYVGEGGTQYFIKPLELRNDNGEQQALLDFTFRYKDQVKDSVTINISFLNKNLVKKVDSCRLENGKVKLSLQSLKYMFLELQGKKYNLRYSSRAALADVYKLFQDKSWTLHAYVSEQDNKLSCPSSTQKKVEKIYHHIFSLF